MKRWLLILTAVVASIVGASQLYRVYHQDKGASSLQPFRLAVVGPTKSGDTAKGQAMVAGARLFVERYNARLQEGGRPLEVVPFDDGDSSKLAAGVAHTVAADPLVVAVLGHRGSSASLVAARVYRELGVPMVGATATAPAITEDNPWAFRVVPDNELQGSFLARYLKASGVEKASVVFDRDDYGRSLADAFEKSARALKLKLVHKLGFDGATLEKEITAMVGKLGKSAPGTIFIAAGDDEAAQFIKAVDDAGKSWPMVGNASLGKQSFPAQFARLKKEQHQPGYYTNGLLATSSLIFDVANESAQYFRARFLKREGAPPDAAAAAYYDAAGVVADALGRALETGGTELSRAMKADDLRPMRTMLRDALARMNEPDRGFDGVTGKIFFDADGDVVKAVPVGRYSDGLFVSAPTQLQRVEAPPREGAKEGAFIRRLGGDEFYVTHVVYTGIEPLAVTSFNSDSLIYEAEFLLWFRSSSEVDPSQLEFLNAVEPVELGEAEETLVEGGERYSRYRVKGRFFAAANEGRDAFGEYELKLAFSHRHLPQTNLIYVADSIGMAGDGTPWGKRLAQQRLFDGVGDWAVKHALLYQDSLKRNSYGHPGMVEGGSEQRAFSRFNFEMAVKDKNLSLRGLLPPSVQHWILWGSLVALCLLLLAEEDGRLRTNLRGVWLVEVVLGCCVLAAAEPVILSWLHGEVDRYYLRVTSFVFDVLWWLYLAYILAKAVRLFVWDRLQERTGQHVPNIARHLSSLFIYLMALYGIVAFVLNKDPTSLLATSGLVAMILGLALQSNLVNVFSGIAISLEKPFQIGDRIRMNFDAGPVIGRVVDMNWRSTKIRTDQGSEISMPNGTLANANINNLTRARATGESFTISLGRRVDPSLVLQSMQGALKGVGGVTGVVTKVEAMGEEMVDYSINVDFDGDPDSLVVAELWGRIWKRASELESRALPAAVTEQ